MIKKWLFIFFLLPLILTAQSKDENSASVILHQEGITLLNKEDASPLNQLQALEKFLQSYQLLDSDEVVNDTLRQKNERHIQELFAIFTAHPNTDSLLQTTRFYPDSVFQANTHYAIATKSLLSEILTLKRNVKRDAFFKIRYLKYPPSLLQEKEAAPNITFEKYWSLEVLKLEEWISNKEQQLQNYPTKIKEELLSLYLQKYLSTLQDEKNRKNYASNKRRLSEEIEKVKEAAAIADMEYDRFKKIGFGVFGLLLLLGYFLWKKNDRLLKNNNQSFLEEKKRSEDLLTNMLPAEVVRELKRKGSVKANKYKSVSVFFSDFKNFSQIAETISPEELVQELDDCFTAFDRIIDKYRLQKIKTIGDAYMCVGGLYTRGEHHIFRMVLAALEIQQFLADRKKKRLANKDYFFEARIGIHTGPIVAGVIGKKKIAFDIWGNTVNVAQQMEHHGEVGKVNISGETYALIQNKIECIQRGSITAKNKKEYAMYFVSSVKES